VPAPIFPADGATPLDPVGTGDLPATETSVEPIVPGVSSADAGARVTLGDPGLAASADSGDAGGISGARAHPLAPAGSGGATGDAAGSAVQFSGSVVGGGVVLGSADSTAPGSDATAILNVGWTIPAGAVAPSGDMVTAAGLAGGGVDSMVSGGGAASAAPVGALSEAGGAAGGPNDPHAGFASTTPVVVSGSTPGGLTFHISFDSSVSSAPSSFDTDVIKAFQFYANTFNNPGVSLYYNVGYGEVQTGGGSSTPVTTALGMSETFFGATDSYSTLRSTMSARAATGDAADKAVFANDLPATDPTGGMTLDMANAQEKALGLPGAFTASFNNPDGNIGFTTSLFSGGVAEAGFLGVVEHEIAEVMGRSSWLGSGINPTGDYSVMDLFRYAGSGVRQLSATGNPSYFSLDNGKTDLYNWNNHKPKNPPADGGDLGDWLATSTYTPDAYNDKSDPTVSNPVTSRDTTLMDVIGWDRATSATYTVGTGHTSTGIIIYSGDKEFVKSGGTAVATYALSGGLEVVSAGGVASGGTVSNGGGQYANSGGLASGAVIRGGGFQAVYGGTATATMVSGGSQFVASGGKAIGTIVRSGGWLDAFSAGTSSRTTISKGGSETVSSGSIANVTTIDSGGTEVVSAGGRASGGTVASGGKQIVESGGVAIGVTVKLGGSQTVFAGGTTRGTVLSGGTETVHGTASDTILDSGGSAVVLNGGKASGGTINGGLIEVVSGGTASGTVTFVSGGTLQLDASSGFTVAIKGFAIPDQLDLRGIAFGSGTTLSFTEPAGNTSGTLTVNDGTHTINLTLLGSYTTSNFTLATDTHSGTLVTDPPAAGAAPRVTFADIAPAGLRAGAATAGNPLSYLPSALATNEQPYAGQTLLATGPPGAGDHHPWLPAPR
jgi:autotransporter passenger strand-loop-strand repeat protein